MKLAYIYSIIRLILLRLFEIPNAAQKSYTTYFIEAHVPDSKKSAGDRSFLNFYSLYIEKYHLDDEYFLIFSNKEGENVFEFNFKKIHSFLMSSEILTNHIYIFRNPICLFEILLNKKIFDSTSRFIYYSTDIFYRRYWYEFLKTYRFKSLLASFFYYFVEKIIWITSERIFTNRTDEYDIISKYNSSVVIIPTRYFQNIQTKDSQYYIQKLNSSTLNFLFVGPSGNSPNVSSLNYIVNKIWPKIIEELPGKVCVLNIIGSGWEEYYSFNDYKRDNIHFLGAIGELELDYQYKISSFSFGYLLFGAGIKGKVIEAMANSVCVLSNDVGNEGIECKELVNLNDVDSLVHFIVFCIDNPINYFKIIEGYSLYINRNYSKSKLIEHI